MLASAPGPREIAAANPLRLLAKHQQATGAVQCGAGEVQGGWARGEGGWHRQENKPAVCWQSQSSRLACGDMEACLASPTLTLYHWHYNIDLSKTVTLQHWPCNTGLATLILQH